MINIAMNVLAVCTPKMQFIYILPGWEGSSVDGRVLRDAISRRNGLKVPQAVVFWFWLISSTVGLWLLLQPTWTSSSNKRKRNDDGISEMVDQMKKWRDTYEVASRGMEKVAAVFDKSEDRSQRLFAEIEELGLLTPTETIDVLEVPTWTVDVYFVDHPLVKGKQRQGGLLVLNMKGRSPKLVTKAFEVSIEDSGIVKTSFVTGKWNNEDMIDHSLIHSLLSSS
ncbi:hypothetical protein Pint_25937 [Pistacia integerrima]|uniref:Uncharacterized protein n=1 Tax=Pistacia integerrima TaxID=434235 RepID=A0ACC0YF34_9ROSI|nr:hypothetical protein Pint_25937 [Pistacia integerrima]